MTNKEKARQEYESLDSKSKILFLELLKTYCLKSVYKVDQKNNVILSFKSQHQGTVASFQFRMEDNANVNGIKRMDALGTHYRFEVIKTSGIDYIIEHHYRVNINYDFIEILDCSSKNNKILYMAFQNKQNEFDTIKVSTSSKHYLEFYNGSISINTFLEKTLNELEQKRSSVKE